MQSASECLPINSTGASTRIASATKPITEDVVTSPSFSGVDGHSGKSEIEPASADGLWRSCTSSVSEVWQLDPRRSVLAGNMILV